MSGKAAFEIVKGTRSILTLTEAEVEANLDPQELLDGLEDGFRGLERGEVQSPGRSEVTVPGKGCSLAMPAWRPAPASPAPTWRPRWPSPTSSAWRPTRPPR
ncbi:hypothetical protein GCM10009560_44120 [Nonomuraea longicatena]|uniref:Uncharacterized protein n=2 Tax=Nonomuraea longicatena TaxID=83682 RepID=A0ABP4AIV4_9ACTN